MRIEALRERILSKVSMEPNSGCWLWVGAMGGDGRGVLRINKKNIRAHRVSYGAFVGDVPPGLHVLHLCDTKECVNPVHLYAGTHAQNMADMSARGRVPDRSGEHSYTRKLDEADVLEIRTMRKIGLKLREIAEKYGITAQNVCCITNGRTWSKS